MQPKLPLTLSGIALIVVAGLIITVIAVVRWTSADAERDPEVPEIDITAVITNDDFEINRSDPQIAISVANAISDAA